MEKIRRITFGIMLAAAVCMAAASGRNDAGSGTAGQSSGSGREETTVSPGSRTTEEVPGTSATGIDLPSGENGPDGESGGIIRDMVDDVKDGMEEITTGTTGARENGGSYGNGNGEAAGGTGSGTGGTAGGQ